MKIGLALAGGGVKGAAHIGAIQALEENNIPISAVTGTSIGSIVAALYAMGYTPEEMLKLFKYFSKSMLKTDPKYLIANIRYTKSLLGSGVISGQALEDALKECARLKGITNIQDILMPIAIPAVDIKTGKEYIFTNRKLDKTQYVTKMNNNYFNNRNDNKQQTEYTAVTNQEEQNYITDIEIGKAVRASCSYPGVFAPLDYKDYRFVDGGVLDNVPTTELKKLEIDKSITIKFPPKEVENPRNALDVLLRCMDIMFHEKDTRSAKYSDYILNLDLTSSSTFDIKKIDYCYEKGYQTTKQKIETIKTKLQI